MALNSYDEYVGLPTFEQKGLTALVAGANGISGQHMVRVLTQDPDRWSKVYALSRRPPQTDIKGTEPVALDFLSGTENIKKTLREHNITKVDYIFFFAYKESSGPNGELWGGQEQMVKDNGKMLEDFLNATEGLAVKRVILQTGAKNYGGHIGPVLTPCREDDPRVLAIPNFYYRQEDILKDLGPKYGFTWSVVRPSHVLGAIKGNTMSLATTLGLYFSVQKELGEPAGFPGTFLKWNSIDTFSSATLNAHLEEWCALTPGAENQAFNAANGDAPTWGRTWIDIAAYYGVPIDPHQFDKDITPEVSIESEHPAPDGSGRRGRVELRWCLESWSKQPHVMKAWEGLADRQGVDVDVFRMASWSFADGIMSNQHQSVLDINKSRSMGFLGHVDSTREFYHVFRLAEQLKILPSPNK